MISPLTSDQRARDRVPRRYNRRMEAWIDCTSSSTPSPPTTSSSRSFSSSPLSTAYDLESLNDTFHPSLTTFRGSSSNSIYQGSPRYIMSPMDDFIASLSPPQSPQPPCPSYCLSRRNAFLGPRRSPSPERNYRKRSPRTELLYKWRPECSTASGHHLTWKRNEPGSPSFLPYGEYGYNQIQDPHSRESRYDDIPVTAVESDESWVEERQFQRRNYEVSNYSPSSPDLPRNIDSRELDDISRTSTSQTHDDRGDERSPFEINYSSLTRTDRCALHQKRTLPCVNRIPDFRVSCNRSPTTNNIPEVHFDRQRLHVNRHDAPRLKLQFPYTSVDESDTSMNTPILPIERRQNQEGERFCNKHPDLSFNPPMPYQNILPGPLLTRLQRLEQKNQISGNCVQAVPEKPSVSKNLSHSTKSAEKLELLRHYTHSFNLAKQNRSRPFVKKLSNASILSRQSDKVRRASKASTRFTKLKSSELPYHLRFGVFSMKHLGHTSLPPLPKPPNKIPAQSTRPKNRDIFGRHSMQFR